MNKLDQIEERLQKVREKQREVESRMSKHNEEKDKKLR